MTTAKGESLTYLSLFSGGMGGDLAMQHLLGMRCLGYVEIEEYCQKLIRQRQEDGFIDRAPIFTDIRSFVSDGYAASYTGMVDCITGGFPCQDISCAGKGKGITGERSGLWSVMAEAIRIIRPRFAFVENSPMLTVRGLGTVLGDLAEMGMDARWCVLGAVDAGAFHKRERIWIMAESTSRDAGSWAGIFKGQESPDRQPSQLLSDTGNRSGEAEAGDYNRKDVPHDPGQRRREGRQGRSDPGDTGERESEQPVQAVADADRVNDDHPGHGAGPIRRKQPIASEVSGCVAHAGRTGLSLTEQEREHAGSVTECDRRQSEPGLGRVADGLADRLDRPWPPEPADVPRVATGIQSRVARLKAIGNGQVPQCAALAWLTLIG